MTWIEAIARYVCSRCTGAGFVDTRGAQSETTPLVFGSNCFIHAGSPDDIPDMVVMEFGGAHEEEQASDPRKFPTINVYVIGPSWAFVDTRISELKLAVTGERQVFDAPSATSPVLRARCITSGRSQHLDVDEYDRCVGQLDLTIEYVNL